MSDDAVKDATREVETILGDGEAVTIAGRKLRVKPLVLRDYANVGKRLVAIYQKLAAGGTLGNELTLASILSSVPEELPELFAMAVRDEGGERVDADWFADNVGGGDALDLLTTIAEVNRFSDFLPRVEKLRAAVAAPAGPEPSTS